MKTPDWTRLDNAALIYIPSKSRKFATLFRMSVALDEEVDPQTLQLALAAMVRRFPTFGYTLQSGIFWWTLRKIDEAPRLSEAAPIRPFDFKKNGGYMFKVSCDGRRIMLDVFHSLTDGTGAMVFLLSLTGEYLRLRHGLAISYNEWVRDPSETPSVDEFEDSFDHFSGGKGSLEKNEAAYHIRGHEEKYDVLNNVRITIPVDKVVAKAKEYGCTVTDLITSAMIMAVQDVRSDDTRSRKNGLVKVSVPVNLRKIFGGRTMRNFSSYVNLGVDATNGRISFDDTLREVALQKKLYTMPSRLQSKVCANVLLEDSLAIRCMPRIVKSPVMAIINKMKGDKFYSHTFSNLGLITLPEGMDSYVESIDFKLGRKLDNSGACGALSYGGKMYLNFSRKIVESDFEEYFIKELASIGIDADVDLEHSVLKKSEPVKKDKKMANERREQALQLCLASLAMTFSVVMMPFVLLCDLRHIHAHVGIKSFLVI